LGVEGCPGEKGDRHITRLTIFNGSARDSPHISYGTGSPFTFIASLDTGGGYQFNVKMTGLAIGKTYQLLCRVVGEDSGSYHADAKATFALTK
jgi:hypothetical protein